LGLKLTTLVHDTMNTMYPAFGIRTDCIEIVEDNQYFRVIELVGE
jgi:hypothetical protein